MSSREDERSNDPAGTAPVALSAKHFSQLMTASTGSQSMVDAKLQQFREQIRQSQEEATAKTVKWARSKKPYTFRRRVNEEQETFNAKLEETLPQAKSDLSAIPIAPAMSSAIQRVKESLQKVSSKIAADKRFATANLLSTQREVLGRSLAVIFSEALYKLEQQEKETCKMSIRNFGQ